LKPYITVTQVPPEDALSAPTQCVFLVDRSYAKAVVSSKFQVNSVSGEDKHGSSFNLTTSNKVEGKIEESVGRSHFPQPERIYWVEANSWVYGWANLQDWTS
jgi:hypothetical protein